MNYKKIVFILITYFLSTLGNAQPDKNFFEHLTIFDGLSLSSIYAIHQDKQGFIWFGTEDGLNRYDGYSFQIFRPQVFNNNSLSNKWIEDVFEDASGNLWIFTRNGVNKFNPKYEQFTRYLQSDTDTNAISDNIATCFFQDSEGVIWIGTINGLNKYNPVTNNFVVYKNNHYNEQSISNNAIKLIYEDANENLWIGTENGLNLYQRKNNRFIKPELCKLLTNSCITALFHDKEGNFWIGTENGLNQWNKLQRKLYNYNSDTDSISNNYIETIYQDSLGNIWIGTGTGFDRLNNTTKKFQHIVHDSQTSSNSLAQNIRKPILEERAGLLWFGTFNEGIFIYDSNKNKLTQYTNDAFNPYSISQNSITEIFKDRTGIIWIGTFGAGLNKFAPRSRKFDLYLHHPQDSNSIPDNFVWSVFEDSQNNVWLGTNAHGACRFNYTNNTFQHYPVTDIITTPSNNYSIREIYQDKQKNIWFGTASGLIKYSPVENKYQQYYSEPENNKSLSDNSIRVILQDSKGRYWIGTRNGLNLFDNKNETFKRYQHDPNQPNSLSNNFIYSALFEDKDGILWIGTYGGGLNRFNPDNETFTAYTHQPDDSAGIINNIVFSITQDRKGFLWIGTNGGLEKMNPQTGRFTHYTTENGIPNNVIYGALIDHNQRIWMSTNLGLACMNIETEEIKTFDIHDGLQSNEFNGGAYHKGNSGRLYFAGVNGLNVFHPDSIHNITSVPEVVITKMQIHNHKVKVKPFIKSNTIHDNYILTKCNNQFFLSQSILYTKKLHLTYKENTFSFRFAGLHYAIPEKNLYKYRLKGFDKEWIEAGSRNFAYYTNIPPGKYVFEVMAANCDGVWNPVSRKLQIVIKPPFWQELWFKLLVALAGIFLVYLWYKNRINRIKTQNVKLNALVKERTAEVEKQKEEILSQNNMLSKQRDELEKLNATKDKFFAIISHDLKNPFTSLLSITSSLNDSSDELEKSEIAFYLNKIHNSANQIYSLLENLLQWATSHTGRMQFHPTNICLNEIIQNIVALLAMDTEKKQIDIQLAVEKKLIVYADRNMVMTVLRNLINNAIKFSDNQGTILIQSVKEGEKVITSITDNGIGIENNDIKKLFRIDIKTKAIGKSTRKGSGLGLIICKEFIEKNNGVISVKSKIGEGSTFTFSLPAKKQE